MANEDLLSKYFASRRGASNLYGGPQPRQQPAPPTPPPAPARGNGFSLAQLQEMAATKKKDEGSGGFNLKDIGMDVAGGLGKALGLAGNLAGAAQRTVVSTVDQVGEGIADVADGGDFDLFGNVKEWQDQVRDAEYGVGSALTEHGLNTGNKWADRAIGFIGDVATDPLTYLTFGTATVASKAGRAALAGKAALEGIDGLADDAVEEAIGLLGKYGPSHVDAAVREGVGARKAGAYFGIGEHSVRLPGTGRVGGKVEKGMANAREAIMDTKAGQWVRGQRGDAKLKEAMGVLSSGKPTAKFPNARTAAETVRVFQIRQMAENRVGSIVGRHAAEKMAAVTDQTAAQMTHALERGEALPLREVFDQLRDEMTKAGVDVGIIDNYVPHRFTKAGDEWMTGTPEGKAFADQISYDPMKQQSAVQTRVIGGNKEYKLSVNGREVVIPPKATIEQINGLLAPALGFKPLEDDIRLLMAQYVREAGRTVGAHEAVKTLLASKSTNLPSWDAVGREVLDDVAVSAKNAEVAKLMKTMLKQQDDELKSLAGQAQARIEAGHGQVVKSVGARLDAMMGRQAASDAGVGSQLTGYGAVAAKGMQPADIEARATATVDGLYAKFAEARKTVETELVQAEKELATLRNTLETRQARYDAQVAEAVGGNGKLFDDAVEAEMADLAAQEAVAVKRVATAQKLIDKQDKLQAELEKGLARVMEAEELLAGGDEAIAAEASLRRPRETMRVWVREKTPTDPTGASYAAAKIKHDRRMAEAVAVGDEVGAAAAAVDAVNIAEKRVGDIRLKLKNTVRPDAGESAAQSTARVMEQDRLTRRLADAEAALKRSKGSIAVRKAQTKVDRLRKQLDAAKKKVGKQGDDVALRDEADFIGPGNPAALDAHHAAAADAYGRRTAAQQLNNGEDVGVVDDAIDRMDEAFAPLNAPAVTVDQARIDQMAEYRAALDDYTKLVAQVDEDASAEGLAALAAAVDAVNAEHLKMFRLGRTKAQVQEQYLVEALADAEIDLAMASKKMAMLEDERRLSQQAETMQQFGMARQRAELQKISKMEQYYKGVWEEVEGPNLPTPVRPPAAIDEEIKFLNDRIGQTQQELLQDLPTTAEKGAAGAFLDPPDRDELRAAGRQFHEVYTERNQTLSQLKALQADLDNLTPPRKGATSGEFIDEDAFASYMDGLDALRERRDSGVLTEAEYATEVARMKRDDSLFQSAARQDVEYDEAGMAVRQGGKVKKGDRKTWDPYIGEYVTKGTVSMESAAAREVELGYVDPSLSAAGLRADLVQQRNALRQDLSDQTDAINMMLKQFGGDPPLTMADLDNALAGSAHGMVARGLHIKMPDGSIRASSLADEQAKIKELFGGDWGALKSSWGHAIPDSVKGFSGLQQRAMEQILGMPKNSMKQEGLAWSETADRLGKLFEPYLAASPSRTRRRLYGDAIGNQARINERHAMDHAADLARLEELSLERAEFYAVKRQQTGIVNQGMKAADARMEQLAEGRRLADGGMLDAEMALEDVQYQRLQTEQALKMQPASPGGSVGADAVQGRAEAAAAAKRDNKAGLKLQGQEADAAERVANGESILADLAESETDALSVPLAVQSKARADIAATARSTESRRAQIEGLEASKKELEKVRKTLTSKAKGKKTPQTDELNARISEMGKLLKQVGGDPESPYLAAAAAELQAAADMTAKMSAVADNIEVGKRLLKLAEDGEWTKGGSEFMTRVIDDGFRPIRDQFKNIPGAEGRVISQYLDDAISNVTHTVKDPGFWKHIDDLTKFFKTYATMTPGFHVRNAMSGAFMNASEGVTLKASRDALKLWSEFERDHQRFLGRLAKAADGGDVEARQTLDAFDAIFGSGVAGSYSAAELGSQFETAGRLLLDNKLTRASHKAGEYVEGPLRLALALHSTRNGMDKFDAMARVSRIHFNYGELSDLDVMAKRVIPFWTFMSRNLPLQIQQIFTKPKAYAIYNNFVKNFDVGEDGEVMPEWMKDVGGFTAARGVMPGGRDMVLTPDLPFTRLQQDLENFSNPSKFLANATPFLRVPAELATDRSFFFEGPINENPLTYAARNIIPPIGQVQRLAGIGDKYQDRQAQSILNYLGLPVRQVGEEERNAELRRRAYEMSNG